MCSPNIRLWTLKEINTKAMKIKKHKRKGKEKSTVKKNIRARNSKN